MGHVLREVMLVNRADNGRQRYSREPETLDNKELEYSTEQ